MGKKNTDNYNKDYFTANGIPQAAAEEVPDLEKAKLTRQEARQTEKPVVKTGPNQNEEIARAMGHTKPDR